MAKKRGQNEGSVFQRKDGLWVGAVTINGERLSKYEKTQKAAREWVKTTLAQVDSGLTFAGAQVKMKEFLEQWLITAKSSIRLRTFEQYTQVVNQHLVPVLGNLKLKDLRPDHIQTLYNSKLASGSSSRTVIIIHSVIHRALNHAVKLGLVGRNPADAVSHPRMPHREMQTLTDNQVRELILVAKGTPLEAMYQLAVTTGLRQGELLGLRWSDLEWKTRKLKIQRQLQRYKETGLVFVEPKTAAGRRVVTVGSATIQKLREHFNGQQLLRQASSNRWKDYDLIFPSSIGTPMENTNLLKRFKADLKKAGLPDIRFHDLRHTAATLMLQQGVHPKVVQERLGHSEIGMTLNTYSHVLPSMQDEAAEKLDELFTPIDVTAEIRNVKETANSEIYLQR